ncbi:MAG: hypothetical protein H5T97_02545 [Firmicutes bacterium]|nr:hypothetical protein [Bacillota bacterium]
MDDLRTLREELRLYNPRLLTRARVVAANKMDLPAAEEGLARIRAAFGEGYEILPVSGLTGAGVDRLVRRLAELLEREKGNGPGAAGP